MSTYYKILTGSTAWTAVLLGIKPYIARFGHIKNTCGGWQAATVERYLRRADRPGLGEQ